jgi:hypothetical protein
LAPTGDQARSGLPAVAVIDATTPEAADALVEELAKQPDMIRGATRPDGGEFFDKNGMLFCGWLVATREGWVRTLPPEFVAPGCR